MESAIELSPEKIHIKRFIEEVIKVLLEKYKIISFKNLID